MSTAQRSTVLVVGEALVDIVERVDGSRAEHPGGSPANVALGLGRLGRDVTLLTRLGDDARGGAVRSLLTDSGVTIAPASFTADPTSTATAHLDAQGVATYEFVIDWQLPEQARDVAAITGGAPAVALHTGSIAAFLPPGGDAVLDLVRRSAGAVTVTYDPNARPRLMGDAASALARVEEFVRHADVVKVSDEDLAWLLPGQDPVQVAGRWLASGPSVVVVTLGGEGAVGLCAAGQTRVAAPKITVVDTVGAGDSFMAALIDHLAGADLLGADHAAALRAISTTELTAMLEHAVRVAAITCGRAGANPPTRADLDG